MFKHLLHHRPLLLLQQVQPPPTQWQKCVERRALPCSVAFGRQFFSSVPPKRSSTSNTNDNEDAPIPNTTHRQPFVTGKLEPGEWDINRKDPYFRPKPPRSKMISAEDFANRPAVGFDSEFSTYEDSMIALSWLDTKTCRQIYQLYVDMMIRASNSPTDGSGGDGGRSGSRTSHEYVIRVLAERFQITTQRAAGVVQLQHAEEQMRWHNPELLCEEQAQYAEQTILKNISDAYRAERSQPPGTVRGSGGGRGGGGQLQVVQPFVEDPVGIHGRGEPDETSKTWVATDDIYDMDRKLQEANTRDAERARLLLDDHVYVEDMDEAAVPVPTDGAAHRLLKAHYVQQEQLTINKDNGNNDNKDNQNAQNVEGNSGTIPYPEQKRPRWKYVAQVVNTRAMRKKGRRLTSYVNNRLDNTLVEEDGALRVATVAEAKQVAWKPTRQSDRKNARVEAIYEGAKKAWLERTLKGKTDVWGKAPRTASTPAASTRVSQESVEMEPEKVDVPEEEEAAIEGERDEEEDTADESSLEEPDKEAAGKDKE